MIPQPQVELPKSRDVPNPPKGHESLHPQDPVSLDPPGEYPPLVHIRLNWASLVLEEEKENRTNTRNLLCRRVGWEGKSVSKAFLNLMICHFLIVLNNCVIIPKYFSLSNRTHNYILIEMCKLIIRICKYIIV